MTSSSRKPKLIGCAVCGKMVNASAGRSPIDGKAGWRYLPGGSLACSNECHEEIDPGIPVERERVKAMFAPNGKPVVLLLSGRGECRECGTINAPTERRCRNEDCRFPIIVACAACEKDVIETESFGDGDIGDEDIPSFCSSSCFNAGPCKAWQEERSAARRRD